LTKAASRPSLPNVTLVAVTSVALDATIAALHASMAQVDFGQILLLSDRPLPPGADPRISWRQIERLESSADYSRFMLRELAAYISTGHTLCVQWDGFVLDGGAWDPAFVDYDYIGAVWPHFDDAHNVGNGGFSLRSQRLMEASRDLPFDGKQAEDVVISRIARPQLEAQGIRFAPASVAGRFAYERTQPTGSEFGFHGAFNLVRNLPIQKALELFRTLEPQLLARSERFELLRWAVVHGRVKLAMNMLARLI
jgi:hypothetical protein